MDDIEKENFLHDEYVWNKERMDGLQERAMQLFGYNILIFGFIFTVFDYEKFGKYIRKCMEKGNCDLKTIILVALITILIIGIIKCSISLYQLYSTFSIKMINCFDLKSLEEKNFQYNVVFKDYKEILKDLDENCKNIAEKVDSAFKCMLIGIIWTMIPFVLIKFLLNFLDCC